MESVSRRCMIELACDLCGDWKKLGYLLDLSKEVEQINQDFRKNVVEQSYRILQAWKQKNGSKATYQSLGAAMRKETISRIDLAEKYCEGGNQGSLKTASHVPPKDIQSLNAKMEQLQVGVAKETECAGNCSGNADVEKVNKDQTGSTHQTPVPDDCIRKKFISLLPYKVWKVLVVKLDPTRELLLGGDFRDLAGELGFDSETVLYFQTQKNPTETVLKSCSSLSVEELCNKLEVIGRVDAKTEIDQWVKSQDCNCVACANQDRS